MFVLDNREALCNFTLEHGAQGSYHLLGCGVLMEHAPHGHVVVSDQLHALSDDGLALFLVIVIIDNIQHAVQEDYCGMDLIDDLEDLSPAVGGINSLTQPDNLELFRWLLMVYTGQTADAVLDGNGVILTHLSVYVEHHGLGYVAQLIAQVAQLSFEDARHELTHQSGLAVSGLSLDHMEISYLGKGYSVVTESPAGRHIGLGEIQIEAVSWNREPVVTL